MQRAGRNWKIRILYETGGTVKEDIHTRHRHRDKYLSPVALPLREGYNEINKKKPPLCPQGNCHALPAQPARTRRPCGTWKFLLSAALFPT